jgi:multidrug efflux pump subunit AcrB
VNFAAFTINRWQLSLVMFVLLAVLGINALTTIPRSVDPHFPIPIVSIIVAQPGANAADIEQTVIKPIEATIRSLDDVKEVRARANDGAAVIVTEFDWSGDPEQYFNDVVREVGAIRDTLPQGIARIEYRKARTTTTAVLQLALVSKDASWQRIDKYAEDFREAIVRNPGVRGAYVHGLPAPQVQVLIDPGRLAQLQLAPAAVANALRQGGSELPPGAVQSGDRRFNIEAGGAFRDLDAIRALPLRAGNGAMLTVGDVARVEWGAAEQLVRARYNGERSVFITIQQKDGIDVIRLRRDLEAQLQASAQALPPDMRFEQVFDQSRDIEHRLSELTRDFSIAVALVALTLLPLGWRASLIVMISIPLSLATGLLAISWAGYNLSQLTVAGFIVALGLLVDDSIVVTENIARHLREGQSRREAAIQATREITPAVLGSTLVLIFAFAPLLFLPEGAGMFTRSFIFSIIFTIGASLIVSLTIIPFLASRILPREAHEGGNPLLKWLTGGIERLYRPVLHQALEKPRLYFYGAMALCLSAFALVPVLGFSLFPYADTSYFRVTVEAEEGSSIANTDRLVRQAADIVRQESAIQVRAENIGGANPQVFYNVFGTDERPNYGEVLAVMERWDGQRSVEMVDRLRHKLDRIPGASIQVVLFQNGAPISAPIAIRVRGENLAKLSELAGKVEAILRKTPGARDVDNPLATQRIDLDINIDEGKAALLGVPEGEARRALRLALSGEPASSFRDEEGDTYPVVVRLPFRDSLPVSALDRIYVANRAGAAIPLSQIAAPVMESVPPQIERFQQERVATINAHLEPGALANRVTQAAMAEIDKIALPEGYRIGIGGEAEAIGKTFSGFGTIVAIALFGIFAVLVAEFGRFRDTIVVAGVIPLGTFGGLIALLLTGNSLSYMAVIGFVALVGIEIKNSILLVDFTAQLRREGLGLREAIEKAGEVRFLPVLLTSVTAVGGLLPLALFGGSLYSSLAWVIIGGLVSSTLLSRIVTPVMYLLVARGAPDASPAPPAFAGP